MKQVNCPESHHLGHASFLGNNGNTLQVCLAFGPGISNAISREKGAGAGTCLLLPYSIAPASLFPLSIGAVPSILPQEGSDSNQAQDAGLSSMQGAFLWAQLLCSANLNALLLPPGPAQGQRKGKVSWRNLQVAEAWGTK